MLKLIILSLQVLSIICQPICSENGLQPNPDDITSYFECIDGKSHLRVCPKTNEGTDTIFDGKVCSPSVKEEVIGEEVIGEKVNEEDTTEEIEPESEREVKARSARQASNGFYCPQTFGIFADPVTPHWYYQCSQGLPLRQLKCPVGTALNTRTLKCIGTANSSPIAVEVVDREVNVVQQPRYVAQNPTYVPSNNYYVIKKPRVQVIERQPTIRELVRPQVIRPVVDYGIQPDVRYVDQYPVEYVHNGRRFRRNARVETEDEYNGNVVVDTWNEDLYKWERNPHGTKLLPELNGWHDHRYTGHRHNRVLY